MSTNLATEVIEGRASRYSPEAVGIGCALLGTTLFSLKPILIKIAYANGLSPDAVIGLRMFIALPFYVIIGMIAYRRLGRQVSMSLIFGAAAAGMLGFYVAAYLDLVALTYISSQLERIVLFTYPTWVIIFGAMFIGEAITRRKIIALGLSYHGVIAVVSHDFVADGDGITIGIAFAFCTTIVFSAYTLTAKHFIGKIGTGLFTSVAMGSSSFMILGHLAVTDSYGELLVSPEMYVLLAGLSIGATVAPSYLMSAAVGRIGAGAASIVSTVGPAVTSVFAVIVLGEAFTIFHALGLALTAAGIVVLTWTGRPGWRAIIARASAP